MKLVCLDNTWVNPEHIQYIQDAPITQSILTGPPGTISFEKPVETIVPGTRVYLTQGTFWVKASLHEVRQALTL